MNRQRRINSAMFAEGRQWCVASRLIMAIAIVTFVGLTGCGKTESQQEKRSGIVATIFPLYDLIGDIAGKDFATHLLLPAGRSPHEYELTPSDRLQLRTAKVLVTAGGGIDSWIVKAALDEENRGLIIIDLYEVAGGERLVAHEQEDEERDHSAGHSSSPLNPHQWLVPRVAEDFAKRLTKTLVKLNPENADSLETHLQSMIKQLNRIDNDYREQIRGIKDRRMITFHDAFEPLAEEYGLDVVATIYRVESQQLTPADMTRIKHFINDGVRAVFTEPQFESGSLKQLGNQITIRMLDPLGGRTRPPGYATYYEMIETNLKVLIEGLRNNRGNR